MKSVKIRIECTVCKKFNLTDEISVNKHGFFVIPDAYCPYCLCPLKQIINHDKGNKQ